MIAALGVDLSAASHDHGAAAGASAIAVATTRLPFPALGLTRRGLDEALLRQAAASGATVLRGHRVRGIAQGGCVCWAAIAVGSERLAQTRVPRHRQARSARRARVLGRDTGLVGLKMYFALDAAQLAGAARPRRTGAVRRRLCRVCNSWKRIGRCCALLVSRAQAARRRRDAGTPARFADGRMSASRGCGCTAPGPCSSGRWRSPACRTAIVHTPSRRDPPGLFRLGDQAAVIASLTGDGVALALASGSLAARTLAGTAAPRVAITDAWQRPVARRCGWRSLVHRLCLTPRIAAAGLLRACGLWPGAMRLAAVGDSRAKRLTHSGYAH